MHAGRKRCTVLEYGNGIVSRSLADLAAIKVPGKDLSREVVREFQNTAAQECFTLMMMAFPPGPTKILPSIPFALFWLQKRNHLLTESTRNFCAGSATEVITSENATCSSVSYETMQTRPRACHSIHWTPLRFQSFVSFVSA